MDIYEDEFYDDFREETFHTYLLEGETEEEWLYVESFQNLESNYLEPNSD